MGELPSARVGQIKPFSISGVDFGGPFFITLSRHRGVKTCKAYLCLFICLATKAVHLELATDLTSDTFISALQRFIARRGRVSTIYCDNATNFVGASRELNSLRNAASKEGINFKFSPANAPHFNGLSEAGIKSVKTYLKKIVGEQVLTYEEFYTILTLIESILNSRPLTPISSDIEDINALTPSHFLTLEPVATLDFPDLTPLPMNRLSRLQMIQRMHQTFWKRWYKEYLNTLQQRHKWLDRETSPKIGQLVIIKDDNLPPSKWLLGRILTLYPGTDSIARVATVKTATGLLKRPLVKLCPLPGESDY